MKKHIYIPILVILGVVIFLIVSPFYMVLTKTMHISPIRTLLSWDQIRTIDNQTNFLILGIAGGAHDGPNLSDSILVINYDFSKNRMVSIGVPRDVWSTTLGGKINSAYAIGEAKEKGGGIKLAKAAVGTIIGMPIEYGAVIDFDQFQNLIDYLGGVDVNVARSFTDHEYPLTGKENDECGGDPDFKCRYETISFTKGMSHMDGTTALKFVRSRHADGAEGSDFARSKRQQLVISAVKEKVMATIKSLNADKISALYSHIDTLIQRDITNQQAAIIAKDIAFGKKFQINNYPLPRELFTVPEASAYDGQYVLTPTNNDSRIVHDFVSCLFANGSDTLCLP